MMPDPATQQSVTKQQRFHVQNLVLFEKA